MPDPTDSPTPQTNVEMETGPGGTAATGTAEPERDASPEIEEASLPDNYFDDDDDVEEVPDIQFHRIPQGIQALVTFDHAFMAPDGEMYKAAWGPCYYIPAKTALGFDPRLAANWFLQVGQGDACVFVAGCQVHYAVPLNVRPRGKFVYVPEEFPAGGPIPD